MKTGISKSVISYKWPRSLACIPRQQAESQAWAFHGVRRSIRVGADFFKSRFVRPQTQEPSFLDECRRAGINGYPSSYGDVYHRLFKHSRPCGSVQHDLDAHVDGGWQQARMTGWLPGIWYVYDLVSAYASAALQGLPAVRSARPSYRVEKGGMYVARFLKAGVPAIPTNLRPGRWALLSTEEIERYDLRGVEVRSGCVFRRTESIEGNLDAIRRGFRDWKSIFRSFWGAWASAAPVECSILRYGQPIKTWEVRRPSFNPVWAHTILARVKMRVAEHAPDAAHVYVDSVMLPHRIREGSEVGDWRLVRTLRDPVVYGAGNYCEAGSAIKHAGVSRETAEGRIAA